MTGLVPVIHVREGAGDRFRDGQDRRRVDGRDESYGGDRGVCYPSVADLMEWSDPMTEFFDAHRPATAFDHDSTLVVAMELSGKYWQLGAVIPGVSRRAKVSVKARDINEVISVVDRWKAEAVRAGRTISRVVAAYEGGVRRVLDRARAEQAKGGFSNRRISNPAAAPIQFSSRPSMVRLSK